MKRKRGALSLEIIGKWLLLLTLLVVIISVFYKPFLPRTREYLKLMAGIVEEKEFTPYEPEEYFTSDEEKVDNSMKALVCAVNSVALGKPTCGEEDEVCVEGDCTKKDEKGTTDVTTRAVLDKKSDSKDVPPCNGVSYGDVCVECDDSNGFSCDVKGFELPQKISNAEEWINGYGDPKHLVYYEKFPEDEQLAWQFDKKTFYTVILGVRTAFALIPFASKGMRAALSSRVVGNRLNKIGRLTSNLDKLDDAAKTKQLKKITKLIDKTGDDGIRVFVNAMVKGPKGALSGAVVDDVTSIVLKEANLLKFDSVFFNKVPGTYTNEGVKFLRSSFKGGLKGAGLTDDLAKQYSDDFIKLVESGNSVDDAVKSVLSEATSQLDDIADVAIKAGGELSDYAKIMKKVGFYKSFKAAVKSKDSVKATANLLKKNYPALNAIKKTDPKLYNSLITKLDDTGQLVFGSGDDVSLLLKTAEGASETNIDTLVNAMAEGGDEFLESMAGTVYDSTTKSGLLRENMRKGLQFIKKDAAETAKCLALVPSVMAMGPLKFMRGKVLPTRVGALKGCAEFLRYNYLPIMFGMGYTMEKYDSANQKFNPVGRNTIAVVTPLGLVQPEEPKTGIREYDTKSIDNLYLSMQKEGSQDPKRFFLASPCKVDLKFTRAYCGCNLIHKDFVYEFEEKGLHLQAIEPIASETPPEPIYMWDDMTEEEKTDFLSKPNYFAEQRWIGKGHWENGFEQVRFLIRTNPEFLKKYLKLLFPDAKSFLWIIYQGDYTKKRVSTIWSDEFKKIENFNKAELDMFFDSLVDNYDVEEEFEEEEGLKWSALSYPNFNFKLVDVEISIPQINYGYSLLDQIDLFYPFISFEFFKLPRRYWMYRGERVDFVEYARNAWGNDPQFTGSWPWDDASKPWQERKVDWAKLDNVIVGDVTKEDSSGYYRWELLQDMLAHRFYNSSFFNERAKESAFQLYYYSGPLDKVVKKCNKPFSVTIEPSTNNRNKRLNLQTTVPCINIEPKNIEQYARTWNDGNNYCFTGENVPLKFTEEFLQWATIAGGLALIPFSGGTTATMVLSGAEIVSVATSYVLEKCGEWPRHKAGLSGCF